MLFHALTDVRSASSHLHQLVIPLRHKMSVKIFKQRLKMKLDHFLSDIVVIIRFSNLHQLPSPSFSLQMSVNMGNGFRQAVKSLTTSFFDNIIHCSHLGQLQTPSSLLSQEKSVMIVMKKYQNAELSRT